MEISVHFEPELHEYPLSVFEFGRQHGLAHLFHGGFSVQE